MNNPVMVKTFEEIARKQDGFLRRKAEKLCNDLIKRYGTNIPLQNAFLLIQRNDPFSGKYSS